MDVAALTSERWDDFVDLFTRRGARGGQPLGCNGCWCMWWRGRASAEANRAAMERLVRENRVPGLLAFDHGRAIGWVAVDRRESYTGLMRSRAYQPQDADEGVWAITCLFVHSSARGRGVADVLVEHAVAYAFDRGAAAVEAYPPAVGRRSDYMGSLARYRRLGFVPVGDVGVRTRVRLPAIARRP